ncbi:hypothetical protein [Phycicoccus flavus]|uniref:hypothetical protein n=1 Tax=Phycicoccus flavus TaxID=2502783 RepID=UPI000FEBE9B1|nr:hypothetical protein [Phycicoccus flavus]NHA69486.1 hypothetical protein [Phycicoccus flavus]
MTTIRRLRTALAGAALAVATPLALAAPAQAAGPVHGVETLEFTAQQEWLTETCGFPVTIHVWGSWNTVTWTGADGAVTREIRTFRFRSTTSANGISLAGLAMGPETITYAADGTAVVDERGVVLRRVPGAGTVTLFAGYRVHLVDGDAEVVLDAHGQAEDVGLLCAALTP